MKPKAWMEMVLLRWEEDPSEFTCLYPEKHGHGTVLEATSCELQEIPDDCGEFTCWPKAGQPHYTFKPDPFPHIIREVRGTGPRGRILMPVTEHGGIGKCSLCGVATTPRYCVSCKPTHRVCTSCWSSHRKAIAKLLE